MKLNIDPLTIERFKLFQTHMNFCTHCDKNYFYKAFALWKSLTEQCESFTLHWLCNDDDTFRQLNNLKLPNVIAYSLTELEKDEELSKAKSNPPCKYGTQYSQYCWTLTPYFTNYILKQLPEGEKLIYADSDIFFYHSPKIILDIIGDKAIGIHSHGFSGAYRDCETGWYNVGVTVLTNNEKGREISDVWKGWLLNPNNEYYNTHGMCGDQKYLDLFPKLWHDDVCVFDDNRCNHLAPWNTTIKEPVIFFHFSHFNIDMNTGKWRDSNNGEWHPARDFAIQKYYNSYAISIKALNEKYLQ